MIKPDNYDRMRSWFAIVSRDALGQYMTPETDPLTTLDHIASTHPAKARQGLSMAIGDLVELTNSWPKDQIAATDQKLSIEQLPTLTEVRANFSKEVQRIVRRGHIQNEVEYQALRNAAELSTNADELWKILATYETNGSGAPTA